MKTSGEGKRKQIPAQARKERAESIDLSQLPQLREVKEFVKKFLGDQLPSSLECADAANIAYKRADALLEYCVGMDHWAHEAGPLCEPVEGWVVDSIKLQVEQLFVVNKRLIDIHYRGAASGPGE